MISAVMITSVFQLKEILLYLFKKIHVAGEAQAN